MTATYTVKHSTHVLDAAARAVLFLAVLYSFSLFGHLGYLLTKNLDEWAWMRYPFMGFAKPVLLSILLFVFWTINRTVPRQLRWTWLFALMPLSLVFVELSHTWQPGQPVWQLIKEVMYVKYINSAISLALVFALFESALIAGLLDGRFLKTVTLISFLCLAVNLLLKYAGATILSMELYKTVAWNNSLAYESAVALWILLAYRDKLDLSSSSRYVMILLVGIAGILLSTRGAILLIISLLFFHTYLSLRRRDVMNIGEKWIIYTLLTLNLWSLINHHLFFLNNFNFYAAKSAQIGSEITLLLGDIGGNQPTYESDEVMSVVGRIAGIVMALNVFKENILLGAGAWPIYEIDFQGIGIHSLWPLVLAAAGLAGTLPQIVLLGRYLYGAFQSGSKPIVITTIIFLFFGTILINLYCWWYALILILCIHPYSCGREERSFSPS
jgi:hypothetical protein